MTKKQKILDKLIKGQALTFDEIHTLLTGLDFNFRVVGSHYTYSKKAVKKRMTIPKHGKTVKPIYLKLLKELLKDEI